MKIGDSSMEKEIDVIYRTFTGDQCPHCQKAKRPYHFFLDCSDGGPIAIGFDGASRVPSLLQETPYAGVYRRIEIELDSFCDAQCLLSYIQAHLEALQAAMDAGRMQLEREDAGEGD